MSPRPVPPDLLPWALASLGLPATAPLPSLAPVAGDASARRYFRFTLAETSYILAEAPPASEKNAEFVAVGQLLADAGVPVPDIHAVDLARGYLLLGDLGDDLLLPALDDASVDGFYQSAGELLLTLAGIEAPAGVIGRYDRELLQEELDRFAQWLVEGLLGLSIDAPVQTLLQDMSDLLIESALEQPVVLVHRDFHSRNLMLLDAPPTGRLGVIDFQDAVAGPITYDLASLLRDCYIRWSPAQVKSWAVQHRQRLLAAGLLPPETGEAQFLRWFDWMGLQRHIKVLGTFARLHLRDGKDGYLADLPLVLRYVAEVVHDYAPQEPVFAAFGDWFGEQLAPVIAQQSWSVA